MHRASSGQRSLHCFLHRSRRYSPSFTVALEGLGTGAISTRRFFARPSLSVFELTGCCEPNAAANTEEEGTPASINARVTVNARWADSSQLSAKRRLLSRSCRSSVKPLTIRIWSLAWISGQRPGQALQYFPAFGLQLIGVERE